MTLTLEMMQSQVKKRGGEVLSKQYLKGGRKMRFRCKEGHTWWAQAYEVNKGTWCPKCGTQRAAEKLKFPITKIKEFAKEKDGECLSSPENYKNSASKLKWLCSKGHKFSGSYHIVKRRINFCKKCAGV